MCSSGVSGDEGYVFQLALGKEILTSYHLEKQDGRRDVGPARPRSQGSGYVLPF